MGSKERIAKALAISTDTKVFEMSKGASALVPEVFKGKSAEEHVSDSCIS